MDKIGFLAITFSLTYPVGAATYSVVAPLRQRHLVRCSGKLSQIFQGLLSFLNNDSLGRYTQYKFTSHSYSNE